MRRWANIILLTVGSMNLLRARKGLSPLVASVILIAFTVVGGFIVYEYFLSSSRAMISAGEEVILNVSSVRISNTTLLVHVSGVNGHGEPISINALIYYDSNGSPQRIDLQQPIDVQPGEKFSIDQIIPSAATAVTVEYTTEGGKVLTANPSRLS